VAGAGAEKRDIKKHEKTGLVSYAGRVSDGKAAGLYAGARALLYPGIEDLGLVPIEANAAGCPVIAFRDGGALDTVKENVTGLFFDEQSAASLIGALDRFESMEAEGAFRNRDVFSGHVQQFSPNAFRERIRKIIAERKRV